MQVMRVRIPTLSNFAFSGLESFSSVGTAFRFTLVLLQLALLPNIFKMS